jgi:hypothetical protein
VTFRGKKPRRAFARVTGTNPGSIGRGMTPIIPCGKLPRVRLPWKLGAICEDEITLIIRFV